MTASISFFYFTHSSMGVNVLGRIYVLKLAYECPHEAGKALHLLDRKEMAYT